MCNGKSALKVGLYIYNTMLLFYVTLSPSKFGPINRHDYSLTVGIAMVGQ